MVIKMDQKLENYDVIINEHLKQHEKNVDTRLETNQQILRLLSQYINENPHQRFIQVLWNLDIVNGADRFAEEPQITLKKIEHRLEQQKQMKERITKH